MRRRTASLAALLATIGATTGCGPEPTLDAPEVHYGMAVCEVCGMIVSDERYAAAIVMIEDGRSRFVVLDDIGELFDFQPASGTEFRRYVNDQRTLEWVEATEATYLVSDNLKTPMATGVAAFASRQAAAEVLSEFGGSLVSFAELPEALRRD